MAFKRFAEKGKRSIAKRAGLLETAKASLPASVSVHPLGAGNREIEGEVPFSLPHATLADLFADGDQVATTMLPCLIRKQVWAMPEHELLTLGELAKLLQPKLVVEFGNFMGGSTLAMAANIPSNGRIATVDLDPTCRPEHEHGMGGGLLEFDVGGLFRGTQIEHNIEQHFANTVEFSDTDLVGRADVVFVAAGHTYEFAKRDTATALKFLRPGGAIIWHDYSWTPEIPECVGVTKTVNEFSEQYGGCRQITGLRFATYHPRLVAQQRVA